MAKLSRTICPISLTRLRLLVKLDRLYFRRRSALQWQLLGNISRQVLGAKQFQKYIFRRDRVEVSLKCRVSTSSSSTSSSETTKRRQSKHSLVFFCLSQVATISFRRRCRRLSSTTTVMMTTTTTTSIVTKQSSKNGQKQKDLELSHRETT